MYAILESRVTELEEILGINAFNEEKNLQIDLNIIKQKLNDLNIDFVKSVPIKKLRNLKSIFNEGTEVSFKDKLRSIDFLHDLIVKKADLLQELQKTSDIVLESKNFQKARELLPHLTKLNKDIEEALKIILGFECEVTEFHNEMRIVLTELKYKLDEIEKNFNFVAH